MQPLQHSHNSSYSGARVFQLSKNKDCTPLLRDAFHYQLKSLQSVEKTHISELLHNWLFQLPTNIKTKNETKKIPLLPGRAGILRRTGGATASEMLTVTMMTKLVVVSRATEHIKKSSASQTTGLSGAVFPPFSSVSSFWELRNGFCHWVQNIIEIYNM